MNPASLHGHHEINELAFGGGYNLQQRLPLLSEHRTSRVVQHPGGHFAPKALLIQTELPRDTGNSMAAWAR